MIPKLHSLKDKLYGDTLAPALKGTAKPNRMKQAVKVGADTVKKITKKLTK